MAVCDCVGVADGAWVSVAAGISGSPCVQCKRNAVSIQCKHMPRKPLTRDRVLRSAIQLADQAGLDSLSMRKLAQQLGVEAMSLYHHVRHKGDLVDGMIDLVFAEIGLPSNE